MVYAQINNLEVINTVTLDDISLLSLFSNDPNTGNPYDAIIQIDNIFPQPGIGWAYINGNFTPPPPPLPIYPSPEYFQMVVNNAIAYGNQLIVQIASQNVSMGITQYGKTLDVMNYTAQVILCLNTGSLYEAINQINILIADTSSTKTNVAPFITNDNLTSIKYQIQNYLGVPNS
jgi:hypothetical protein